MDKSKMKHSRVFARERHHKITCVASQRAFVTDEGITTKRKYRLVEQPKDIGIEQGQVAVIWMTSFPATVKSKTFITPFIVTLFEKVSLPN